MTGIGYGGNSRILINSSDDGVTWTTMLDDDKYSLYDVWGVSSTDIYVVGNSLLHYVNGILETTSSSPDNVNPMHGIWGLNNGYVFTCGDYGRIYRKKL
jgi:hypothetical protein